MIAMGYALDYSAGRPAGAAVRASGYAGVIRYVGFDPAVRPKCITAAEYRDMLTNGVDVALVYEDHAGDALAGRAAGRAAAERAQGWADAVGFPPGRPIYFACDTDVVTAGQFSSVGEYLRGAADVLGDVRLVGVYGEYDVVEYAARASAAAWYWQTKAWSVGQVSPRAHLLQLVGTVTVGGVACDRNEILRPDWGQATEQEDDTMAQLFADRAEFDRAVAGIVDARLKEWLPRLLTSLDDGAGNAYFDPGPAGTLRATLNKLSMDLATLAARVGQPTAGDVEVTGRLHLGP